MVCLTETVQGESRERFLALYLLIQQDQELARLPCRHSPEREQNEIHGLVWERIPGLVWEQDLIKVHLFIHLEVNFFFL